MPEDSQQPGASLSPLARQLAESLADRPLDPDGVTDPALNAAVAELVDAGLAVMQNRDGRLLLRRTVLPP